ncbi:hypothetical protein B0H11DRAFT_1728930 [Mycena galericulata]|nr:hypothetical protein B0H11DRAFT_1728930 [Mycena galericulata]
MPTNYAAILGIKNKWAPILFAVIYFLVMIWYLVQSIRRRGLVYIGLAFFSALRVVSFSLRAAMANNHRNDAFSGKMAIAYEVLYNIGFFSILLSAYRLLHDRRRLAKIDKGRSKLHRILGGFHKGRIMELLLLISVILGALGTSYALGTNSGRTKLGYSLGEAAAYIFLAVTIIIALLTFLVIHIERGRDSGSSAPSPLGTSHHHLILVGIAVLLLLRMLFIAATIHQRATGQQTTTSAASSAIKKTAQGNEHLWYPLAALSELLAVLLFLTPGMVVLKSMFEKNRRGGGSGSAFGNEKGARGTNGAGYAAGDASATGGLDAADAHNGANLVCDGSPCSWCEKDTYDDRDVPNVTVLTSSIILTAKEM